MYGKGLYFFVNHNRKGRSFKVICIYMLNSKADDRADERSIVINVCTCLACGCQYDNMKEAFYWMKPKIYSNH